MNSHAALSSGSQLNLSTAELCDVDGLIALMERLFWLARMDAKRGDQEAIEFLDTTAPDWRERNHTMSNPVFSRVNETHVPIPVELHDQLRAIATRHETPVNDLIAAFLRQAVQQTAERQHSGKRNRIPDSAFAV